MTWQSVRLLGFSPDAPENTPGILTYTDKVVPTDRGFGNSGYVTPLTAALNDYAQGGAILTKVDGTQRIFVGTGSKLYENVSGVATDRSGSVYNATNRVTWSFGQFGDVTLAANKNDTLQACTTGSFAAVSGAPKASIIVVPSLPNLQFVMAFDYDDGTNNYADGIFWSAASDYTDWTPSIATQAGNVRVIDIGGPWTAAIPFRDGVVAFKRKGMYLGQYVGPPALWEFKRISGDVGCIGKNAVVDAMDALWWADEFGFWTFDGSYPRQIPGLVHQFWSNYAINNTVAITAAKDAVRMTWDKQRHRLWFSYGGDGSGSEPSFLVFNPQAGTWTQHGSFGDGTDNATVGTFLSADYAVGKDSTPVIQTIAWDSSSAPVATMRMHVIGNAGQITALKRLRPQWLKAGTSGAWVAASAYRGRRLSGLSNGAFVNMYLDADGGFDVVVSDRYLQPELQVAASTSWEVSSVSFDVDQAGEN